MAVVLHTFSVTGAFVLKAAYVYRTNKMTNWYDELPAFATVVVDSLHNNFMFSSTVVGLAHAFVYSEQARRREKKMAEREKVLVIAELDGLRAQMNPHYSFQCLRFFSRDDS